MQTESRNPHKLGLSDPIFFDFFSRFLMGSVDILREELKNKSFMENASAESFHAKLKAFRATLRGVTDASFFCFRAAQTHA
tara:strand:+ start:36860 stop:37102 length:243 start_codon:yes stop_codon:yes gene_type:complete